MHASSKWYQSQYSPRSTTSIHFGGWLTSGSNAVEGQKHHIEGEFEDVGDELDHLDSNGWGQKIESAAKEAFEEEHWVAAEKEYETWAHSTSAKNLEKELDDVSRAYDKYLKVEDLPKDN